MIIYGNQGVEESRAFCSATEMFEYYFTLKSIGLKTNIHILNGDAFSQRETLNEHGNKIFKT